MSGWSIYLTFLHLVKRSKMNESLPDMTLSELSLDVSVWSKEKKIQQTFSAYQAFFNTSICPPNGRDSISEAAFQN